MLSHREKRTEVQGTYTQFTLTRSKQCTLRVCHENTVTGRLTKNERGKKRLNKHGKEKQPSKQAANEQNTLTELFLHMHAYTSLSEPTSERAKRVRTEICVTGHFCKAV